ncbi:hypothetical protein CPB84DRAFT_1750497 [Gymnopilus junonius]|uniref:F-box domain-containing protein n=1 Tax=Gymnopilus junonius TaxID=109634 RepID=A0A9P5TJY1_GYMJU|nr:hypothetical protein CPB84DRAFT_1750497 [Gymnopilus junonius]
MDLKSENYNPAVDTLRHISQVSSSWRNLALNSSPLWGCVLNLTRLEGSKKWLDEVVKRSKKSWLYIKAVPKGEVRDIRYNRTDRIWDLDLKPALEFGPIEEPREWCSLFSRSSNLRSLKVDSMIWVSDLFPVLCPHLELLELSDDSRSAVHIQRKDSLLLPGPPISLPGLKKIKIKSHWPYTVDGVMMALQRIAPAASCLLYLHCRVGRFPGEMNFIADSMPLVIPKYLCCARETLASMESPFARIVITTSCVDFTFSSGRLLPEKVDDGIFRFALDGADHAQLLN